MVGRTPTLVADTKSASSRRTFDLDSVTVAALRAHRARQLEERLRWGEAWTDTGLVFTREDGTMLDPERVTKEFRRLAKAAGLPVIRLHDLRHSYASSALAAGVPIECCPSGSGTAASRSPRTSTSTPRATGPRGRQPRRTRHPRG
jgi:integrase